MAGRILMQLAALSMALTVGAPPSAAQTRDAPFEGSALGKSLVLERVPLPIAVEQLLGRVSSRPYVFCNSLIADKRLISVRLAPYQLKLSVARGILSQYGYGIGDREGLLYVCNESDAAAPSPSGGARSLAVGGSQSGPVPQAGNSPVAVRPYSGVPAGVQSDGLGDVSGPRSGAPAYSERRGPDLPQGSSFSAVPVAHMLASVVPDFIAPKELLAAAGPMFPDLQFALVDGTGARPMIFATGPVERIAQFEQMADYLDRAPEGVEVQALVLEVTDGKQSGFGLELVLDQLRNGLGLDIGSGGAGDALSFRAGSFSAVLSAVNSDTRVKVVSSPRIRGRSGEALRLQVGADVPVLGAVIENPQGSIAQSVQYRSSGVIFEVAATVYGKRIAVDLRSELSAFAATESGVQGSPTLSTRVLQVALDLQPGEWAVVGGLSSEQVDDSRQSLLGLIPTGRRTTQRKSELVLLVTVNRVGVAPQLPVNNWAGKDDD